MIEFLSESWQWLVTLAFGFGTVLAGVRGSVKALGTKMDNHTTHIEKRLDDISMHAGQMDATAGNHEVRIVVLERDAEHHKGWLREIRDQMREVHQHVMKSK